MSNETKKKNTTLRLMIVLGLILVCIIAIVASCSSGSKPSVKLTGDPKVDIPNTVKSVITGTVDGKPQYEKVEIRDYAGNDSAGKGKLLVDVYLLAGSGLDANGAMQDTISTVKDVSKALFTKDNKIYEVAYYIDTQLKDSYGNVSNGLWTRVILNQSDGNKIQYDNLSTSEFAKFLTIQAGTVEAHDAFAALLNQ